MRWSRPSPATARGSRAWPSPRSGADRAWPRALLLGLERALVDLRVRLLSYVLPEEEQLADGLANAGFTRRPAVAYFDKVVSSEAAHADVLAELGGQVLPSRLWDDLAGHAPGEGPHRASRRRAARPARDRDAARRDAAARGRAVRAARHRQDVVRARHRQPPRLAVRRGAAERAARRPERPVRRRCVRRSTGSAASSACSSSSTRSRRSPRCARGARRARCTA